MTQRASSAQAHGDRAERPTQRLRSNADAAVRMQDSLPSE